MELLPTAIAIALAALTPVGGIWLLSIKLTWQVSRQIEEIKAMITEHQKSDDSEFARVRREFDETFGTIRREFGETCIALRQKITDTEIFMRDNFVRTNSFDSATLRITDEIRNGHKLYEARLIRMESKLDNLKLAERAD